MIFFSTTICSFYKKTADCCGNSKNSVSLLFPQQSAVFHIKTADCCGNNKISVTLMFPQQSAVFQL